MGQASSTNREAIVGADKEHENTDEKQRVTKQMSADTKRHTTINSSGNKNNGIISQRRRPGPENRGIP